MTHVSIRWADEHLRHYAERLELVNRESPLIVPRIVNQVGNRDKTKLSAT